MLKKVTMTAIAGLMAIGATTQTQAADVTLRFAHFWPSVAGVHKELFQVWADKVKEQSDGKIEVQIFPSSTLAKPPAQYEAVKNRIADVTATVQGYTANRFPLTQIVELPGLVQSAKQGSCIIQGLYDEGLIKSEYKDTKPLFFFTHGPGHIHTGDKLVKEPTDLAGLRIRRPTAVVAKILEELNAKSVGMPAPQSYQSMQRGVIDGVALPYEGMVAFRLNELAKKHTEVGGLYTLSFVVTMNSKVYDSMPAELKKVIDDNSGLNWSKTAAKVFDKMDVIGRDAAVKEGHEIHTVEGGVSNPVWKPILDKATESYLSELEGKGLPARKVYARAQELSKSCVK
ncbi:MAG: TRAP transporter substrate-binding protein [Methylocystaceae bacterium]|nr:TRAP transporter substrate-binding protein [Methylocystaceae bacterium]